MLKCHYGQKLISQDFYQVRFHIQQESDIPASTQLYNQICFAIAARHYPPGHRLPSTRQLAMQTGLHRNTISKVYRQLEIDGVVEAIAGSGIYVRDNLTKREFKKSPYSKDKISKAPDQEAKKIIDNLINLGCTLQETREILTNEIDWRIKCGSRIIVSTPSCLLYTSPSPRDRYISRMPSSA